MAPAGCCRCPCLALLKRSPSLHHWTRAASRPAARSFVKGLEGRDLSRAQLGLAHSYSRAKVKFNVNKSDNMIIQVRCWAWVLGGAAAGRCRCWALLLVVVACLACQLFRVPGMLPGLPGRLAHPSLRTPL